MLKKIIICLLACSIFSCNEDNDDNIPEKFSVTFIHKHNWDAIKVDQTNFTTHEFTNENGEVLNIARLRYLTSRYQLTNTNGDVYTFDGYSFVDISNAETYTFKPTLALPTGTYTLKLVWGFNEEDNIDGAYPDLNAASWNWPSMLGGGYHFMQFDGMYNINTANPKPFNYHNGTARVSDGVFEQNFVNFNFETPITITSNTNIEINMNIAEWFKNPNTWDLNQYDTPLMPNYDAQKLMQQNAASVLSIGTITNE